MAAKNLKELAKQIEDMAKKAMQRENSKVKKVAIETGKERVQEDVYNVYEPKIYSRTGQLKESWVAENTQDGVVLYNTRRDGDKYIPEVVETGIGYDYTGYGYAYESPRPFIKNTKRDLENGNVRDALKEDLKSLGIDVE